MSQDREIPLRESRASDNVEQRPQDADADAERDASPSDQAIETRRIESRKRAAVLVGSAILQLPIWGRRSFDLN